MLPSLPPLDSQDTGDPCNVLVVDDDLDVREGLTELLMEEGLDVAAAKDGLDALEYLRSHAQPDVVLLDLMMPRMSGPELRHRMLADPALSQIPVIVLTAAQDGRSQARALGAAGYFTKPFRVEDLVSAIRKHC